MIAQKQFKILCIKIRSDFSNSHFYCPSESMILGFQTEYRTITELINFFFREYFHIFSHVPEKSRRFLKF